MKIKAGGREYPLPEKRLELGIARLLKREYGFVFGRDEFDLFDPDHASAFLFRAMLEAEPGVDPRELFARINLISEIEFIGDDGKPIEEGDTLPPTEEPGPETTADPTGS